MSIEKIISPLIAYQFPAFYREEGPNFVAFVQAYYEWMEQNGQVINQSRSLMDYGDIDSTLPEFIQYFKNKYIANLPENTLGDKALLIKHITDLYRSKGTEKAYKLLFRMLFNEDIEVFIPGEYIFKPSDANWTIPKYIEVTSSPFLSKLVNHSIYGSAGATAVVDSYFQRVVNGKTINILYLSAINGQFKFNEEIYSHDFPDLVHGNAPIITGSLSTVSITNGGYNYNVGDLLNVEGSGQGGIAKVASTRDENGKVVFTINNGGYGFTTSPVISITPRIQLNLANSSNTFAVGDIIQSQNTYANATVVFANSIYAEVGANTGPFYAGDIIIDTNNTSINATATSVVSGGGQGASFQIGNIINKQILLIYTDQIQDAYNQRLEVVTQGFSINIASSSGTFTNNEYVTCTANTKYIDVNYVTGGSIANGETLSNTFLGISGLTVYWSDSNILYLTGTNLNLTNANLKTNAVLTSSISGAQVQVNSVFPVWSANVITVFGNGIVNAVSSQVGSNTNILNVFNNPGANAEVDSLGYFIPGSTITGSISGKTATVVKVSRSPDQDWTAGSGAIFPAAFNYANLDAPLYTVLKAILKTIGQISYLNNINPGSGYTLDPVVLITEPDVYNIRLPDGSGGFWGHDAVINGKAGTANGIATSVVIQDAGFGYSQDENVFLANVTNPAAITGTTVVDLGGISTGYWKDHKSFLSDSMNIQDSNYYQQFSYEIVASRMVDTYKSFVLDLVHPTGFSLFGRFSYKSEIVEEGSIPVSLTLTQ
jgi:hypothetical protein